MGQPTTFSPHSPLPQISEKLNLSNSVCVTYSESVISDIDQLDGNASFCSNNTEQTSQVSASPDIIKTDKKTAALSLPIVATYNLRSLFPKVGNLTTDILERKIDLGFLQEIWEQSHKKEHQFEIEKMLELHGLKYISTSRPPNAKGVSYGGAAIVVNLKKFSVEKLNIHIPKNLEVIWGLLKPKNPSAKFKKIIVYSFYSPPNKKRNSKMADYISSTLQMLSSKHPQCGLILGADRNYMDIKPILNSGLKLRQVVDKNTRGNKIHDIIIMNLSCFYKSPIIAPPIKPDDPNKGKLSDHSVPVCIPHTDRYRPASRNYRTIKYRPLPDSSVRKFGEWIVTEDWNSINNEMSSTEMSVVFEQLVGDKLNKFCPEKEMKLSSKDKAFITKELKQIDRQKSREYEKRGKTLKYKTLENQFQIKYKIEGEKYLNKNLEALRDTNPGQAYNILKKLGAQPGDCIDSNTFTLPSHESEGLSEEQSAERIAEHFAEISQEFPPLNILPPNVQT